MNIDITRLLTGGAEGLPLMSGELTSALTGKDFGIQLDEKLVELGLVGLPIVAELLAQKPENIPVVTGERDGESLPETARADEMLAALTTEGAQESPQWQLQQLVARNAAVTTGAEVAPLEAIKPSARQSMADVVAAVAGKAVKADKPQATLAGVNGSAGMVQASVQPVLTVEAGAPENSAQPIGVSPITLPAATRPAISPAPVPVATVSYPPEAPEWKHSVSQQIVMFSRNGIHNAEIRLHPEELGSLHITLRLHQEQAQVHIVSEHAQVRQAMEQAMPQLRTAMAESGIQLGQASVGAENPHAGADAQGEHARTESEGSEEATEAQSVPQLLTTAPGNVYGINTFA